MDSVNSRKNPNNKSRRKNLSLIKRSSFQSISLKNSLNDTFLRRRMKELLI